MIRYYYTKWKLLKLHKKVAKYQSKLTKYQSKLTKLQTVIATGFTTEKAWESYNKKLISNKRNGNAADIERELQKLRSKHANKFQKPDRHFPDSRDRKAVKDGHKRSEYVRILKNRPLRKDPDDLINPPPQGDRGMLNPDDERNKKGNRNG